jgi:NAD(P) transhydrogenase subunit alpha
MIMAMNNGSIIVDMATSSGGNVAGSLIDKVIVQNGVTIIGYSNLAAHIPYDSSRLYAKNLYNLVTHIFKDGKLNTEDEIVTNMLLTNKGKVLTTIIG